MMDAIDKFLALAAKMPDRRIGHRIHRVTTYALCKTHFLRIIPSAGAMTLWRGFYNRQTTWFESFCTVPISVFVRRQVQLPSSLTGPKFPAAE